MCEVTQESWHLCQFRIQSINLCPVLLIRTGHIYCLNFDKLSKNKSLKIKDKFMDVYSSASSELDEKCFEILGIILNDGILSLK